MTEIRVGALVVHARRPEWGPGKVFAANGDYVLIGFRDLPGKPKEKLKRLKLSPGLLELAPEQADSAFEGWTVYADQGCNVIEPRKASRARGRT